MVGGEEREASLAGLVSFMARGIEVGLHQHVGLLSAHCTKDKGTD